MSLTEESFLIVWLGGILALLGGLVVTRLTWREDVRPFGRGSPVLDIVRHPEKYARPSSLRVIRVLNALGLVCLSIGVALLACEAVWPSRGR
jgi:hypothetical protein